MKMLIIFLLISQISSAQNSEEWFNQQKTKEKRLKEQIAATQVYIQYAQKGYKIARSGISTIQKIKNGDFNLHRDFFNALSNINPNVRSYSKVADIIAMQIRIMKEVKECLQGINETKQFTTDEVEQCNFVFNNLLNSFLQSIDELLLIITDKQTTMKDDERIKRIDALYADMQDKYAFTSDYSEELALLTVQRMRELKEVDISRKLNGIR